MGFYYLKSASVGLLPPAVTRRLPVMNLVPRGIKANFAPSTPTPSVPTTIPTSANPAPATLRDALLSKIFLGAT